MKKRGSAIVIAILLITAIGGIAFSFGRVFLLDAANASLYENGISAYYAAESGIEEGFLRYRYNRDSEVPFGDSLSHWVLGEKKVYAYDLTSDVCLSGACERGGINKNIISADASKQVYDLRMGFIGTKGRPYFGMDADNDDQNNNSLLDQEDIASSNYASGEYTALNVSRDEALRINLTNLDFPNGKDIDLFAKFISNSGSVDPAKAIMQLKIMIDFGDGKGVQEIKSMVSASTSSTCTNVFKRSDIAACQSEMINSTALIGSDGWTVPALVSRLKSITNIPALTASLKGITMYVKPLFYDMKIGISPSNIAPKDKWDKSEVVPGPYTTITATGYYGGVARTLEANIDRQSGTLYDLFDYVIYKSK